MKTIGVIGGFGPEATAHFYLRLAQEVRSKFGDNQPRIIVRHVSVSRKIEHDALILGKNINGFLPCLIDAAKKLQKESADCVVLPCNTLHVHEKAIRAAIEVPFVSIVDATANFLLRQNIKRVGFLGSRVTVQENLFKRKLSSASFVLVPPAQQREIDRGIDRIVEKQQSNQLKTALSRALSFFDRKSIHHVLLACTDFHGLCPKIVGIKTHDTLDILVSATVNML